MTPFNILRRATLVAALACSGSAIFAQTPTKLILGHGAAPGNPRHEASVKFAEIVKAQTGGRIEIQVAHSSQLGDDAAMVTALRSGTLDMSANSQGAVSTVVPEYSALGLPFLFSDISKAWQLLDGSIGQELAKRSQAKGMIVLGYWDNGIRHISNSKRPIKSPADVKGLKIRTPPDAITVDIMQALGADPQQISPRPSSTRCRNTLR
jgi:TRAP-type transport system periplasmic protein